MIPGEVLCIARAAVNQSACEEVHTEHV